MSAILHKSSGVSGRDRNRRVVPRAPSHTSVEQFQVAKITIYYLQQRIFSKLLGFPCCDNITDIKYISSFEHNRDPCAAVEAAISYLSSQFPHII